MTNAENQRIRDREKWNESALAGYDKAGDMPWCKVCEFSVTCKTSPTGYRCDYGGTSGDFDKVPHPCATSYNRMKRAEYSEKKKRFKEKCISMCIDIMKKN